jgi:hypothetical protein
MITDFTATFITAAHAKEFAENAGRTLSATAIARQRRVVKFAVEVSKYESITEAYGDVQLTVHHYGTDRAKVTATPSNQEPPMTAPKTDTAAPATTPGKAAPTTMAKAPAVTPAKTAPAKAATPVKVKPTTVKEMTREQKRAVAAVLIEQVGEMVANNWERATAAATDETQKDIDGVSAKVAGELIATWLSYCPGTAWHSGLGARPRGAK